VRNNLENLSQAGLSALVLCLWVRPGAHPRVEQLKGTAKKLTQSSDVYSKGNISWSICSFQIC